MEKISERMQWIRELIQAEEQFDQAGVVDFSVGLDPQRLMAQESLQFLSQMKAQFIDCAATFNDMKSTALGRIKIYGIARTVADFMLFRNGYKMIFSLKEPGLVSIRFNFVGAQYIPSAIPSINTSSAAQTLNEEVILQAKTGPFGEIQWTHNGQVINLNSLVKYHMALFIRESRAA